MRNFTLSVKVENRSGVLARIAGLFSARGYNIDSLTVSATEKEDISIMTIVGTGDDRVIEQVKKQLNKLIDVIKISDHTDQTTIERELALIRVNALPAKRGELYNLGEIFNAELTDISTKSITFGVKGEPSRIDNFIEILKPYGIKEMMRTGRVSLLREKIS